MSPRNLARVAGVFYLILGVSGGFAHVVVRGRVYESGDGPATASEVAGNLQLVRIGVLADVIGALAFLVLAMALYALLHQTHRLAAGAMVVLVAIASGMTVLNLVFQVVGAQLAAESVDSAALAGQESASLVLLMFDLQFYGYILVQAFTGPWLLPLGYLLIKSNLFPKMLGRLLMVGCGCYLLDMSLHILAPDFGPRVTELVLLTAVLAEMWLIGYLLIRGVRSSSPPGAADPQVGLPAKVQVAS